MKFNAPLLSALRTQRQVTQSELARALSLSATTVKSLERGDLDPRLSTLNRLAEFFKVDPQDFLI